MSDHLLFRKRRNGRVAADTDRFATYRVKTTTYGEGGRSRQYTDLLPANTEVEAEALARRMHPSSGGYKFDIKRVANFWREYE